MAALMLFINSWCRTFRDEASEPATKANRLERRIGLREREKALMKIKIM